MSDVVYQLDAIGGNKVEREAAKAEKAMNGVQRGSSKAGMAILEASRGIEDFAMAGMRGVMNNIPGFLQNIGVGMGLTGVISVATIAVWKGVEALEAYMNKLHEAKMNKFALPMPSLDYSGIEAKYLEHAIKMAERYKDALSEIQGEYNFSKSLKGFESNEVEIQREIDLTKELIDIGKEGGSEEKKNKKEHEYKIKALDGELKAKKNILDIDRRHRNELSGAIGLQEKSVQTANEAKAKMDEINQKAWAAGAKEYQRLYDLRENPPAQTVAGAASGAYIEGISGKKTEMTDEEMIAAQHAEVERVKKQLVGNDEYALEVQIRNGIEAEKSLEILREKLKEKENELRLSEEEFASEERKTELQKELIDLKKQESEIEKKNAENRKNFEAQRIAMISERVADISPFMTAQGRAGLSGKETQNAMGLIGIARQQLTQLKTIANNTKKLKTAYA